MIEYLLPRISVEAGYPHTIVATCETSLLLPLFRYTPIKAWMLMYHFFSYHYPKWIMKFNLIPFFDNVRFCDEGMVEAVTTLIWAAPRLQSDVQELRVVSPNDLTLGITNYFLVWYYITLMQTCKSKILRYLNLDNMSALSLLIAHFCPEMHAVTKIIDLRKFCQNEWIFMDLKILVNFHHFYYCMHFWTYLDSQIYCSDCFASISRRLTLKFNITEMDAQHLKRK